MNKQKPVWRMNTGRGVPIDAEGTTFIPDSVEPIFYHEGYLTDSNCWSVGDFLTIVAYQTTRTKAAKCERVECDCCFRTGHETGFDIESGGLIQYDEKCKICNGKGYRLEVVK